MKHGSNRSRIVDLAQGAGLTWIESDNYFECNHDAGPFAALGDLVQALERAFDLDGDNILRLPWVWREFEDLETLHGLLLRAIDQDRVKKRREAEALREGGA